ncbi:HNH endonuclease signature motif containing protein [Arthrobacter sp. TMN-50]
MESSNASSAGSGFPADSGPGSAHDGGATDTAAGTTGGTSGVFGPGGPLSVDAIWTAPVVKPPERLPKKDLTDSQTDILNFFRVGSDPDERARSSEEPPALTGRLGLAAVAGLDSAQALDALKYIGEARSWLDAQEAKLATRVLDLQTERGHAGSGELGYEQTLAASEIGAALHLPERTAAFLLDHSVLLTRHCPTTLNALERGRLSRRHAWAVAEETSSMPNTMTGEFAAGYEQRPITLAGRTTVAKFCRQALRLREELHPESITVRHRKAVRDRGVFLNPVHDGMAWFEAYLPVEQAAGIFHRVDTAARNLQGPDEPRTLTQLRADVLVDVLTSAGTTGHMTSGHLTDRHLTDGPEPAGDTGSESASGSDGDAGTGAGKNAGHGSSGSNGGNGEPVQSRDGDGYWGVQARVFVTVPVLTLLGGDTPGELEGYGPIDPETARKLAGHASSFTRILTHPFTGARLGADAGTYRVPKDLQDAVRVRDGTCRHPGCNRLAVFCELDHTIPWAGRENQLR